ncbi:MAG: lipid-A-disaccharide synthase N-terminal domain-containing protein [Candidatus Omnitrophica bacterium]|nr:lipid-A-disaccharide synthase N-terminal domain-containing protein [Candidatus Omnitrophota bacterium]
MPEKIWIIMGLLGQGTFLGWFLLRWVTYKPIDGGGVPLPFRYLAILGGGLLLSYVIYRRYSVFALGQAAVLAFYFCGLWVLEKEKFLRPGPERRKLLKECAIRGAFLLAFVSVLCLFGWRLHEPIEMYYDEVYHRARARAILGIGPWISSHPPLTNMLIALSISLFGDHPAAWRLPFLLTKVGTIFLAGAIAAQLTGRYRTAALTVFLLTFNGLSITQARIALIDPPMIFFSFLSLYLLLPHVVHRKGSRRLVLLMSGTFFGLAMATKLVAVSMLVPISLFLAHLYKRSEDKRAVSDEIAFSYIVIPVLVWVMCYIWVGLAVHKPIYEILKDHVDFLIRHHVFLKTGHNQSSPWWTWPFVIRPHWYYWAQIGTDLYVGIVNWGNILIFWLIPLTFLYMIWRWFRGRSFVAWVVTVGFLAQWLIYVPLARVKFFYYFDLAMPFVALATALFLERIYRIPWIGKAAVAFYMLAVVIVFADWYPLLTGCPVTLDFYNRHMWLASWRWL